MSVRSLSRLFRAICVSLLVLAAAEAPVCFGYELYNTDPSAFGLDTMLFGTPFDAVPVGTFDFGTGPLDVGDANLVLQSSGSVIEALALSLTTGSLFVTLQSERGLNVLDPPPGTPSVGVRQISPDDFWDMSIQFNVDYRLGSRNGPIVIAPPGFENQLNMVTMSNSIYSVVPPDVLVIPGVTDFFPRPFGMVRDGPGGIDLTTVVNATLAVPEPGLTLGALSSIVVWAVGLRRRGSHAAW